MNPGVIATVIVVSLLSSFVRRRTGRRITLPFSFIHAWIAWFILLPLSFATMPLALTGKPPFTYLGAACLCFWLGSPFAHRLAAPLGLPRFALVTAWVGAIPFHPDVRAHAVLAAARACIPLRRREQQRAEARLLRLEQSLARVPHVTGAAVASAGFIAIAHGDRDRGRDLLASIGGMNRRAAPGQVRSLAARWLIADAASCGDWSRLRTLAVELPTRLTRLTAAAAARFLDATDAPTNARLVWLWLRCPARLATLELLRRALRHVTAPSTIANEPLLTRHIATLYGGVSDSVLLQLARDWEDELPQLSLDVRDALYADFAALATERPQLASLHPAFTAADAKHDPQGELEIAVEALRQRHEARIDLPPIEEWGEYVMLKSLYRRAATDAVRQRLAYETAHLLIGNHAVHWLNHRGERPMAHAVFQWLLLEAIAAGDVGFTSHYTRNANVSL